MPARPLLARISLRTVVPLVMVIPVLAVVAALSVIVWINGRAAAADLERQIFDQASQRIQQRITEFVELPGQINQFNAHLIRSGALDPNDLASWQDTLYEQIHAFPTISSIGFATPDRRTTWMVRYPDESTYEWGLQEAGGEMVEFRINPADGSILPDTRVSYEYDPLVRPWYIAGVENPGRQVWSEIYPWVGGDSEIPELGLGLVLTVSDEDGRLLGVHDTELSLTQISTFLMNLKTREGGSVYIVDERQGMVACSETSPLVRAPDIRVYASELQDPRGRAIAAYLNDHPQSEPTVAPRDVAINVDGEPLRVRIQPFHHHSGLRWSVWIALPESELLARTKAAQSQMIRTGLVATLLALALGLAISHFAVRPLLHLVDQIRSIGNGDFDARSEVRFTSELTTLSRSLNEVGAQLQDRLRLKQSLELAMEIQQNLLPSAPPPIDGLEVFGHSTYCDETGGDYYDYFPVAARPDSSLGIAVGDVTGHGIGAALLMATARAALRSRIGEASSLSALLEHTNAMLVVDTKGVNFMTMLLMDIDAQDRSIRWTSAGQSPPFIYCPIADAFIELSSSSLPLGVMESATYTDHHLTDLKPGTIIVLGTDGLWEAQSPTGEPFGIDRIRTVIRSNASRTADEIGELLTSKLDAHCAHSVPSDDITFVVVRITR